MYRTAEIEDFCDNLRIRGISDQCSYQIDHHISNEEWHLHFRAFRESDLQSFKKFQHSSGLDECLDIESSIFVIVVHECF